MPLRAEKLILYLLWKGNICLNSWKGTYRNFKCVLIIWQGHPTMISSTPKYVKSTFLAIQSSFRCPEIHSKRRYKICICSVILGTLRLFEISRGSVLLSRKFLMQFIALRIRENFSDSHLNHTFESENFRFPLSTKNSSTGKCEKLIVRKSYEIYEISFENCTWMERSSRNSVCQQLQEITQLTTFAALIKLSTTNQAQCFHT